uniref:Uncharacterized protein n=1 Tax=Timema douglasi TaxID=61478 RepID=A0A7R8VKB9_TIMDO|nr:unnamed protein product [Timema douglasi]
MNKETILLSWIYFAHYRILNVCDILFCPVFDDIHIVFILPSSCCRIDLLCAYLLWADPEVITKAVQVFCIFVDSSLWLTLFLAVELSYRQVEGWIHSPVNTHNSSLVLSGQSYLNLWFLAKFGLIRDDVIAFVVIGKVMLVCVLLNSPKQRSDLGKKDLVESRSWTVAEVDQRPVSLGTAVEAPRILLTFNLRSAATGTGDTCVIMVWKNPVEGVDDCGVFDVEVCAVEVDCCEVMEVNNSGNGGCGDTEVEALGDSNKCVIFVVRLRGITELMFIVPVTRRRLWLVSGLAGRVGRGRKRSELRSRQRVLGWDKRMARQRESWRDMMKSQQRSPGNVRSWWDMRKSRQRESWWDMRKSRQRESWWDMRKSRQRESRWDMRKSRQRESWWDMRKSRQHESWWDMRKSRQRESWWDMIKSRQRESWWDMRKSRQRESWWYMRKSWKRESRGDMRMSWQRGYGAFGVTSPPGFLNGLTTWFLGVERPLDGGSYELRTMIDFRRCSKVSRRHRTTSVAARGPFASPTVELPAAKMVYESDFYTTRRPYSAPRPTITSYSVTNQQFLSYKQMERRGFRGLRQMKFGEDLMSSECALSTNTRGVMASDQSIYELRMFQTEEHEIKAYSCDGPMYRIRDPLFKHL